MCSSDLNTNIKLTRYVPALSGLVVLALAVLRRPPIGIGWRILALVWFGVMLLNLLSLPVEFNASARAKELLAQTGIIQTEEERRGVNAVLNAGAGMPRNARFRASRMKGGVA